MHHPTNGDWKKSHDAYEKNITSKRHFSSKNLLSFYSFIKHSTKEKQKMPDYSNFWRCHNKHFLKTALKRLLTLI